MQDPAANFKRMKACLFKRLSIFGFVPQGRMLWRKFNDCLVVIEIQKDSKYKSKEEVRFTINVAISIDPLRDFAAAEDGFSSSDIPTPEKCHWRERLGYLLPARADVWWSVSNMETADSVCIEIAEALIKVALPQVELLASSSAMVQCWKDGGGRGLTAYSTRLNLARLLIILGRHEEGEAAIQAMEKASEGRSSAWSVAYEAKALRKLLK